MSSLYNDFIFHEMIKAEKELNPCPFCGCHRITIHRDSETLYRFNLVRFIVICDRCSAQIYRGKIPELVEAWNMRTEQTEVSYNDKR